MNSLYILFIALACFVLGYRFYSRRVAGLFGLDARRQTPALSRGDGVDYVPARNWFVLFGHHFASIAGAGPIIGPIIAAVYWGWLPALLWIVLGTIFVGAVHDFGVLMVSLRQGGCSIAQVSQQAISRRARIIFSLFVWLALILVIGVFLYLCVNTFVHQPMVVLPSLGLIPVALLTGFLLYRVKMGMVPVTIIGLLSLIALIIGGTIFPVGLGPSAQLIWSAVLLLYCFFASVLPVNVLLQPRDYLCGYLLFLGLAAGFIGLCWNHPQINFPAYTSWNTQQGAFWPFAFIIVACGAVSGFHALIAGGTTAKQLPNERYARRIGYGAMVCEGVVAVLVVLALGSIVGDDNLVGLLKDIGPVRMFGRGFGALTDKLFFGLGGFVAITVLNAFILTTLDTATRIGRYLTQELFGIKSRYLATFIVVLLSGALAFSGQWQRIWPAFGAANQLTAALALTVVSCYLFSRGQKIKIVLLPALFMFGTTFVALLLQLRRFFAQRDYVLLVIIGVLIVLSLIMAVETIKALASPGQRLLPRGLDEK